MEENKLNELKNFTSTLLSKKAQKRLAKEKRFEENLESFKQKRKERRKKRSELNNPIIRPQTFKMNDENASKTRIVIHCGYSHLMSDKLNRSLCRQLNNSYAVNRRSYKPVQLYFTNIDENNKKNLQRECLVYEKWDVNISEKSYLDLFDHKDIIFLTSESPNNFEKIDESKVYIIGGLIDRNSHKGYCYNEAIKYNLQHQKLPIDDYMKLSNSKVLTTNQVFQILSKLICNNNIESALKEIIPKRKIKDENNNSE